MCKLMPLSLAAAKVEQQHVHCMEFPPEGSAACSIIQGLQYVLDSRSKGGPQQLCQAGPAEGTEGKALPDLGLLVCTAQLARPKQ